MDKGGIKIIVAVILLVFLVGAGIFFLRDQGEWITLKKDTASEMSNTTRLTGTPSQSSTSQQVSWENLIPSIQKALESYYKDFNFVEVLPTTIYKTEDITGDMVTEALIDAGPFGAYTNTIVLVRLEGGNPVIARLKEPSGKNIEAMFFSGASVRHGAIVNFSSKDKVVYSGNWSMNENGMLDSCEVFAYRWNVSTKIFEYNAIISKEIQAEFCENLAL